MRECHEKFMKEFKFPLCNQEQSRQKLRSDTRKTNARCNSACSSKCMSLHELFNGMSSPQVFADSGNFLCKTLAKLWLICCLVANDGQAGDLCFVHVASIFLGDEETFQGKLFVPSSPEPAPLLLMSPLTSEIIGAKFS